MSDVHIKEAVTHWGVTPNGFGGYTYAAPVALKGKWEDRAEEFTSSSGEVRVSKAVVFLSADVAPGDFIYLGTSIASDPTTVTGAQAVRRFDKVKDLRRLRTLRKAWL